MFDCDSLWCCWMLLMYKVGHFLWLVRWPAAVYAALYVTGAGVFLLSLKLGNEDGKMIVHRNSWAYMFAHPLRFGGHKPPVYGNGSICTFYARMLNMLLFVWPFLLIYFIGATTVVSFLGFVVGATVLWPNLREGGFLRVYHVFETKGGSAFPLILGWLPLVIAALAIWKRTALLHGLGLLSWTILCLSPLLILLLIIGFIALKSRDKDDARVSAIKEVISARKEQFCKMIEFRS